MIITVRKGTDGVWRADPPHPKVKCGRDVTWNFEKCDKWRLDLPEAVFDKTEGNGTGPGSFTATVHDHVVDNPKKPNDSPREYVYSGTVDKNDLEGDSPPTVIVDP